MTGDLRFDAAVVTGAASGIGRALAARLATMCTRLVLADLDGDAVRTVGASIGADASRVDVSEPADMARLAEEAPGAQLVCLNAGIVGTSLGHPWEVPPAEWQRLLAVNVGGVVNGLREFVPRLLARDRPAHILITASLAGLATFPAGGAYAASKHAVVAVAEQAALALADTHVGVTMLCPALVKSGMSPVGADPDDVAVEALEAMRAGRFAVVPVEWHAAVQRRARDLVAGRPTTAPTPDS